MKGRREWFWTIARVILAVGLLTFVFTSVVTITDTVYLADGSEITGRIRQWDADGLTLEIDGDKIEVTGISSEEQKRLIDAWMQRHRGFLVADD